MSTTVHLLAGKRPDGQLVYEDVKAENAGDGCYRLLQSPVFARGAAKGDTIRVLVAGRFEVENYGGKLAIRLFSKADIALIHGRVLQLGKVIELEAEQQTDRFAVYAVEVKQGFDAIEKCFNEALQGFNDAQWQYANVYEEDGQTPLNWWHDFLAK